MKFPSSYQGVPSDKLPNILLVHEVVLVLLPFQGSAVEQLIPHAGVVDVLLDFLVVVRHPGDLSSLPREVADVPVVVQGHEKEEDDNE